MNKKLKQVQRVHRKEDLIMKTLAELEAIRDRVKAKINIRDTDSNDTRIVVGMATCGIAAGARPVLNSLVEEVSKRNLQNVIITQTGCIGVCQFEPVIEVYQAGKEKVTYVKMTAEKAVRVINDHIVNGEIVNEFTIGSVTN
jgi:NADP-reducing hydrogenase subunit HndB